VAAVTLAFLTAASRTVALPVAASALTAGLGVAATVMVLGRMVFQPLENELVDLKFWIWVALAGALTIAYGGWQSMQEEGATFGRDIPRRVGEYPPRDTPAATPRSAPSELDGPPGSTPPPEPRER
jgi:hypothetical protein